MSGREHFDQAAATWDQEERRVRMAREVAAAMEAALPLSRDWSALDFGAGTGLVGLALAPRLGRLCAADTSPAMLEAFAAKASDLGLAVETRLLDEHEPTGLGGPYALILSSMALHHIADVPGLLRRFHAHLEPGGRVALADLDEEDGSFHDRPAGVHHLGFRRQQIQAWLESAGFQEIRIETATTTPKGERSYGIFLASAVRG